MQWFDSTVQARAIDADRRHYILLFVSYITGGVMAVYGLRHLIAGNALLATILLGTSAAFVLTAIYHHRSGRLERASVIQAVLVAGFVLVLVWHGGYQNTALYWVFPFPAVLFGLLGTRQALIGNGLILLILSAMLFRPEWIRADYPLAESTRFLASLAIVVLACWFNEYFRERSHNHMSALQRTREEQANTDPLTRLPNRRFIDASLRPGLINHAEAYLPLGAIMCDIDHFKALNDRFGHREGDEILRQVGELFRRVVRRQDIACRTGGEEFLIFLPQTDYRDACAVAEKIRARFAETKFEVRGRNHRVTASFGVSTCPTAQALDAAVEEADRLLYRSKQAGRNKVS